MGKNYRVIINISENKRRIASAHQFTCNFLRRHSIKYFHAEAGIFVLLDFRNLVRSDWEIDRKLLQHFAEFKVFLASGKDFEFSEPGIFRLVFTQEQNILEVGLNRLKDAVAAWQNKMQFSIDNYDIPISNISNTNQLKRPSSVLLE
jgi:bifunctional pyridoxal-dependent enzyme with beta-cystathionase and maltose regulon repressor activities